MTWPLTIVITAWGLVFWIELGNISKSLRQIAEALAPLRPPPLGGEKSDWYGGGLRDIARAIRERR